MAAEARQRIRRQDLAVPGNQRPLTIFTVTGGRPGPVLVTIGAIHGDEMEGPLALSSLLAEIDPAKLSGTWIVCPIANAEAVAAYTRSSPSDGKNLARVFPGRADGTYTDALAALITQHVILPADYLIDLHSGGVALDSTAFAGYADAPDVGARSRAMAEAFGTSVVWRHEAPTAAGRTISVAEANGIPAIYVEAGGGPYPPEEVVELYQTGVRRVMAQLGMYAAPPIAKPALALHVVGNGDLDVAGPSPETGICTCHIKVLQQVKPDTLCFTIAGLDGGTITEVHAGSTGYVMFARRNRWVEKGELLMALAIEDRD